MGGGGWLSRPCEGSCEDNPSAEAVGQQVPQQNFAAEEETPNLTMLDSAIDLASYLPNQTLRRCA